MNREINVDSGEVAVAQAPAVLRAGAIGSCVAVAVYDSQNRIGGMAHVMLPGAYAGKGALRATSYADNALYELINGLSTMAVDKAHLRAFLVGGANLLGAEHESPGADIVESVTEILKRDTIGIFESHVGGTQRRSCTLDTGRARVTYTVGDSEQRVLWEADLEVKK